MKILSLLKSACFEALVSLNSTIQIISKEKENKTQGYDFLMFTVFCWLKNNLFLKNLAFNFEENVFKSHSIFYEQIKKKFNPVFNKT